MRGFTIFVGHTSILPRPQRTGSYRLEAEGIHPTQMGALKNLPGVWFGQSAVRTRALQSPAKMIAVFAMRQESVTFSDNRTALAIMEQQAKIAAGQRELEIKKIQNFALSLKILSSC